MASCQRGGDHGGFGDMVLGTAMVEAIVTGTGRRARALGYHRGGCQREATPGMVIPSGLTKVTHRLNNREL